MAVAVIYGLVAIFLYKNRENVQIQWMLFIPIILYRSKRTIEHVRRLGRKYSKFWQIYGVIAIPIAFSGMFLISGFLAYQVYKIIQDPSLGASVQFILPGATASSSGIVQFIPVWYFLGALAIILVAHELMHGVVAEAFKLKLKSVGFGLLAIIPLAFVEPDEKQFNRASLKAREAVLASGAFTNFVVAAIVICLTTFAIAPAIAHTFDFNGVIIEDVTEGLPGDVAGLEKGDIITAISGAEFSSVDEFVTLLTDSKPGDSAVLTTNNGDRIVTFGENPKEPTNPYLGIQFKGDVIVKPEIASTFGQSPWMLQYIAQFFFWLFVLNIGIGLFNLLPIGPLDGGKMANFLVTDIIKNKTIAQKVFMLISYFSLALLVFNIFGPFVLSGI
ncbi:MAG: site-2 protease family protein [Nanoarchaeota archaeon]